MLFNLKKLGNFEAIKFKVNGIEWSIIDDGNGYIDGNDTIKMSFDLTTKKIGLAALNGKDLAGILDETQGILDKTKGVKISVFLGQ